MTLHKKGKGVRAIARYLSIGRNTVKRTIATGGTSERRPAANAVVIDGDLLTKLFGDCQGYVERVWEKLKDEHNVDVGYSTVTRRVRELGLRGAKPRACRVPDEPGAEMQHDTSPYKLMIGSKQMKLTGATLYYRFSKQIYVIFYPSFDRFRMKCFFHEALMNYRYSAPTCIVDNSNLAVLRGTGKNAVMAPEMDAFSKRYLFEFRAHELNHPDRKAGEERGFWTLETNFFPGRTFTTLEDLNAQAFKWATETMALRKRKKTNLIPAIAWQHEIPHLSELCPDIPAPYRVHERGVDQYGYVSFATNSYWVPTSAERVVTVLEYSNRIKILNGRHELVTYDLPPFGTRNEIFPKDRSDIPYQPRHTRPPTNEEAALRRVSPTIATYLDYALKNKGVTRYRIIRDLHSLHRRVSLELFQRVVARALTYRVTDIPSLERMAAIMMRDGSEHVITPSFDEEYEQREAYREGRYIDSPDLSQFDL